MGDRLVVHGRRRAELQSFWNATVPLGTQPVNLPYLIVFNGSAGSSWLAECLDRHPRVFGGGGSSSGRPSASSRLQSEACVRRCSAAS